MAQIDFKTLKDRLQSRSTASASFERSEGPRVGYFSLKNDKDKTIVRFMVDSTADVFIIAGHRLNVGGRQRLVSCKRDPRDPVEACPACAAGKRLQYRVYVPLIEYTRDDSGNIVATPRVWERPSSFMDTIENKIEEYGPLKDVLFRVTRNGEKGSTDTTYSIDYCRPEVYKPELYPVDAAAFDGFKVIGTMVPDFDYDKLEEIVNAPENANTDGNAYVPRNNYKAPVSATPPVSSAPQVVAEVTPTQRTSPAVPGATENAPRPRRFY